MLHIASRRFAQRTDPAVTVKVYTNAPAATLVVNGTELGTRQAEDRIVSWPVTLRPGANAIEVRAEAGGEVLTDRVSWEYREPPGMLSAGG